MPFWKKLKIGTSPNICEVTEDFAPQFMRTENGIHRRKLGSINLKEQDLFLCSKFLTPRMSRPHLQTELS
jgi:hypothetical protein